MLDSHFEPKFVEHSASVVIYDGESQVWLFDQVYTCNSQKKLPFKTDWANWNGY